MTDDYEDDYDDSGERPVGEIEEVHSTLREILSVLKSRTDFIGWFWVVMVVLLLGIWPGSKLDRWTDKVWYTLRYNTGFNNIMVEKRPSDCDFLRAPLGDKDCQYKKDVVAIKRAVDEQTKRRIISHDGGKTWAWDDDDTQPQGTNVSVYWEKVTD